MLKKKKSLKTKKPRNSAAVERGSLKSVKSFIIGIFACGAGIDILNVFFEGLTAWALDQLLVKFMGAVFASFASLLMRPILKYLLKTRGGVKFMNVLKKIGSFFARVGKYMKANKVTLGGIFTSVVTGASGITVTVLGYTYDVTDALANSVSSFAWVQAVQINGFNLTPLILGLIAVGVAIWNAFAAVLRGWESPETYAEVTAERKAEKAAEAEATATEDNTVEEAELTADELHKKRVEELAEQLKNDN